MENRAEGAWRGDYLAEEEARAAVSLSLINGVGARRMRDLVGCFGTASRAVRATPSQLGAVNGIGALVAERIALGGAPSATDEQIALAQRSGAHLYCSWTPGFSPMLAELYDCPALLWVRGRLPETGPCVAVVGTRRATHYGKKVARKLGESLALAGAVVVSGLAEGIDIEAHKGALDAGGRTVAVLGSGVDVIYPRHHRRIAEGILTEGAIVSEYPMGTAPDAPNFPRRNRLISGLSTATVIVEAHASGGALITARMALEQNREVFVSPGPFGSSASEGCHRLVQEGAAFLLHSADDLLRAVGLTSGETRSGQSEVAAVELTGDESLIVEALESDPTHVSMLCDRTGMDAADVLCVTLALEMRGVISQLPGRYFVLQT